MSRPLDGQVALVTGGGSGIGLACAAVFLRDGASVTIAGRTEAKLASAVAELQAGAPDGPKVAYAVCDVATEDDVKKAWEATRALIDTEIKRLADLPTPTKEDTAKKKELEAVLKTGKPEALRISVGTADAPAVGPAGQTVRDVSLLAADLMRGGSATPAAPTPAPAR